MTKRFCLALAFFAATFSGAVHAAPAAKETGPAMWVISDADTRIYLFGTFHILPKDVKWQTEAFKKALAEATVVAVETDTESPYARSSIGAMLLEHGVNPSWQTLRGVLGAERYSKLGAIAKRYGIEMGKLQSYRPWLVMMMLSDKVMQANGFSRDFGVERIVLAEALAQHDKILTMETPEAQIKALAAMDTPAALDSFDLAIADLADLKTSVDPLLTAWRTGDVDAIDRLSGVEMRRDAPAAYRALLVNRNANWIERLNGWMKGKGTYFVAVGAAHLAGPDSVLVMLEKRGVKATRVQ
ncbi:MAG: TraB/GumN family protein [Alphaproteobacteria bacterium]|nr:TraB/GumN family protein [Alphaproteobacteria bacterium]